jgi:hypothetical protein
MWSTCKTCGSEVEVGQACVMCSQKPAQTVRHKNLGICTITDTCRYLQSTNPDPSSVFVEHDGETKEVSKHLVEGL